jgi:hypothetical protein
LVTQIHGTAPPSPNTRNSRAEGSSTGPPQIRKWPAVSLSVIQGGKVKWKSVKGKKSLPDPNSWMRVKSQKKRSPPPPRGVVVAGGAQQPKTGPPTSNARVAARGTPTPKKETPSAKVVSKGEGGGDVANAKKATATPPEVGSKVVLPCANSFGALLTLSQKMSRMDSRGMQLPQAPPPNTNKCQTPDFAVSAGLGGGKVSKTKSAKKAAPAKGKGSQEVGIPPKSNALSNSGRKGSPPSLSRGAKHCPATRERGGGLHLHITGFEFVVPTNPGNGCSQPQLHRGQKFPGVLRDLFVSLVPREPPLSQGK